MLFSTVFRSFFEQNMWRTNLIAAMKIIMEVFQWRKKVRKFCKVWKLCILWKFENRCKIKYIIRWPPCSFCALAETLSRRGFNLRPSPIFSTVLSLFYFIIFLRVTVQGSLPISFRSKWKFDPEEKTIHFSRKSADLWSRDAVDLFTNYFHPNSSKVRAGEDFAERLHNNVWEYSKVKA